MKACIKQHEGKTEIIITDESGKAMYTPFVVTEISLEMPISAISRAADQLKQGIEPCIDQGSFMG